MAIPEHNVGFVSYPGGQETASAEQVRAISDRATSLVVDSVARHPLYGLGFAILADRVMGEYDPYSSSSTGIGMRELAQIEPDPDECAVKINGLHEQFGVATRFTPEVAGRLVLGVAAKALDGILTETVQAAADGDIPSLIGAKRTVITMPHAFTRDWSIDRGVVAELDEYLQRAPTVRETVARSIRAQADTLRANGKLYKAEILAQKADAKDGIAQPE